MKKNAEEIRQANEDFKKRLVNYTEADLETEKAQAEPDGMYPMLWMRDPNEWAKIMRARERREAKEREPD